jgi:hypothetical protein
VFPVFSGQLVVLDNSFDLNAKIPLNARQAEVERGGTRWRKSPHGNKKTEADEAQLLPALLLGRMASAFRAL